MPSPTADCMGRYSMPRSGNMLFLSVRAGKLLNPLPNADTDGDVYQQGYAPLQCLTSSGPSQQHLSSTLDNKRRKDRPGPHTLAPSIVGFNSLWSLLKGLHQAQNLRATRLRHLN